MSFFPVLPQCWRHPLIRAVPLASWIPVQCLPSVLACEAPEGSNCASWASGSAWDMAGPWAAHCGEAHREGSTQAALSKVLCFRVLPKRFTHALRFAFPTLGRKGTISHALLWRKNLVFGEVECAAVQRWAKSWTRPKETSVPVMAVLQSIVGDFSSWENYLNYLIPLQMSTPPLRSYAHTWWSLN